jgi:hypothetical protein
VKDVDARRVKHAVVLWKMGYVPAVASQPMTVPVQPRISN